MLKLAKNLSVVGTFKIWVRMFRNGKRQRGVFLPPADQNKGYKRPDQNRVKTFDSLFKFSITKTHFNKKKRRKYPKMQFLTHPLPPRGKHYVRWPIQLKRYHKLIELDLEFRFFFGFSPYNWYVWVWVCVCVYLCVCGVYVSVYLYVCVCL